MDLELQFKEDVEKLEKLNRRQVLFIAEYLATGNIALASKKAGYSAGRGYDLLKMPEVMEVIAKERVVRLQLLEVTAERVIAELAKMAFLDPREFFNDDGSAKDICELDAVTAAAISGLEVTEEFSGRGDDRALSAKVKKYRLADKKGALELLGKYLKMWTDKVEVSGIDQLAERLAKARRGLKR